MHSGLFSGWLLFYEVNELGSIQLRWVFTWVTNGMTSPYKCFKLLSSLLWIAFISSSSLLKCVIGCAWGCWVLLWMAFSWNWVMTCLPHRNVYQCSFRPGVNYYESCVLTSVYDSVLVRRPSCSLVIIINYTASLSSYCISYCVIGVVWVCLQVHYSVLSMVD